MPGKAPDKCTPEICSAIISAHLQSPSAFAVFPLQDWLATFRHPGPYTPGPHGTNGMPTDEERINDPANPHHHWKYRMPVTLESLIEDTDNNLSIRNMIEDSGR